MRVLLDTQAFIYAIDPNQTHKLPAKAQRAIQRADERLLSVLSVSELALKGARGRITITRGQIELGLQTLLVELLPVSENHVFRTFELTLHHTDPFDRMIIAAAIEEDLALIGGDEQFRKYKGLKVVWQ
ncbi:MAG TPA: type II toxin-antitoxin system VapC family toxin [Bryobacteraceae bacterium]|nr:type II toxin-antitoxin system VapC family toxin [Bryobacteraceae bacterium]